MASAGRAEADEAFEERELAAHAKVYVEMLRVLGIAVVRVDFSDTRATSALLSAAGVPDEAVRDVVRAHKPTSGPELLARHGLRVEEAARALGQEHTSRQARAEERTFRPLSGEIGVPVRVDPLRLQGFGYYEGWRLAVVVADAYGEAAVGDGGVVTWTQAMLGNRKERLVTTGIGSQYLAARFFREGV
jgi:hypothetical protein